MLTDDDWWDLAGFAFAHRPLLAVLANLHRLSELAESAMPALRGRLRGESEAALCAQLGVQGRKALLAQMRREAAHAMRVIDGERTNRLSEQILQLQFF